jgi:hypothetical protein
MYTISTSDAPSMTTRFRMSALCEESVIGTQKQGRCIAGLESVRYGAAVPASFQDTMTGFRAWSPPV